MPETPEVNIAIQDDEGYTGPDATDPPSEYRTGYEDADVFTGKSFHPPSASSPAADVPDFLRPVAPSSPSPVPSLPPRPTHTLTPMEKRRQEIEDETGLNMLLEAGHQAPPADVKYD